MADQEAVVDDLEKRLRAAMETKTGFGDKKQMIEALKKVFKEYDTDGSGEIDPEEFEAALVKSLNFVGCRKQIRALFDRYDLDCSDSLGYDEFCGGVLGLSLGEKKEATTVVEKVKQCILERGGKNGIRTCIKLMKSMDKNGNGQLDIEELEAGLNNFGVYLEEKEMDKAFKFFDRDGSGQITITEFLRGLRGKMAKRRVKLVRMAYDHVDIDGSGEVNLQDMLEIYDVSEAPDVLNGTMTKEECIKEFMQTWDKSGDGIISREEFLDYYKDISINIADDDYFELMIRNAWHISGGGSTACRRVLVTHMDGSQTVEEIKNDLGIGPKDIDKMKARLIEQGITDIKEISV